MDIALVISRFPENARAIEALARGVSPEQARWKPSPETWSILEVINHLYDEEREDFRARLDVLLHRPAEPFAAIDPQGWPVSRRYNERDLEESLAGFLAERERSIEWLRVRSPVE